MEQEINSDTNQGQHDYRTDVFPYACALCYAPLFFGKQRRIPDDLCMRCYAVWKGSVDEPWLKFLIRREWSRRDKLKRLRKQGIDYLPSSYDQYVMTLDKDDDDGELAETGCLGTDEDPDDIDSADD